MLSLVSAEPCVLKSIDKCGDNLEETFYGNEKQLLPDTIVLKQGILVELIVGNFATHDGLVNGADGVFMQYTPGKEDIVWIEFYDPLIGGYQCLKMHSFYTPRISPSWTPITRISRQVSGRKTSSLVRHQFPILLACARTIHRSQGLTMDRLAFDPSKVK